MMPIKTFINSFLLLTLSITAASGQSNEWEILSGETRSLFERGQYDEAQTTAEKALSLAEKTDGPNHLNVATSLNNLGWLYFIQGKYAQAELFLKRPLAIQETVLDDPAMAVERATSLNNLALLYQQQGHYSQAKPLMKQSLVVTEKYQGSNHPDMAATMNSLALLYFEGKPPLPPPQ